MPPPAKPNLQPSPLRAQAEARLARAPANLAPMRAADELLHDLQVHQIELEMQNEALRQAQIDLAASRDHYADLYEFAPVGYLTLDDHGLIVGINLTGAALLGVERGKLLRRRFGAFVVAEDHDRWVRHFLDLKQRRERASTEISLRRSNGLVFEARLECLPGVAWLDAGEEKLGAGETAIRIALTDISERAPAKQSGRNFRAIFDGSPIGIGIAGPDRRYRMVNPALCRMLGYSETELLGLRFEDVSHADDIKLNAWNMAGLDAGESSHFSMESRYLRKTGETVWVSLNVVAVKAGRGQEHYTVDLSEDITERKQTEQQRIHGARQQRDTLVREVHHRIKNNLQSVAGLLQRELGRFAALNPRLEAAISQVNAIAVVHGLQSVNPDEAIHLAESVSSVCASIADLTQRPVLFHPGHDPVAGPALRVDTNEAVSLALVMNELILNAVKHSPAGKAPPSVTVGVDGGGARVLIRNAVAAPPAFDLAGGMGLGTGLRLVRSLLPERGAQLTHALDEDGCLVLRLDLTAPVVTWRNDSDSDEAPPWA